MSEVRGSAREVIAKMKSFGTLASRLAGLAGNDKPSYVRLAALKLLEKLETKDLTPHVAPVLAILDDESDGSDAILEAALDRRRATVEWQQRRMDVQRAKLWNVKKALRQEAAVGRGDHQVRLHLLERREQVCEHGDALLAAKAGVEERHTCRCMA